MKKVLRYTFVVAIITIIGYGIYSNRKKDLMPDLLLVNAEALANDECISACIVGGNGCYYDGVYLLYYQEYYW